MDDDSNTADDNGFSEYAKANFADAKAPTADEFKKYVKFKEGDTRCLAKDQCDKNGTGDGAKAKYICLKKPDDAKKPADTKKTDSKATDKTTAAVTTTALIGGRTPGVLGAMG